jgi:hypothetical protein
MKKILFSLLLLTALCAFPGTQAYSQTGFNTTLEFCTGTWCQWCPCGHEQIQGILTNYPNTVVIGYHGGNDPWASYSQGMISLFGFGSYPTGVVGRRTGIITWGSWNNPVVLQSNTIQPGVSIVINNKVYNSGTRQITASIVLTALTDLTGSYYITFVLTEGNIVYNQQSNSQCPPGGPNYIHHHVVKGMINGTQGQLVNSGGTWNQGQTFTMPLNYTIPSGFVAENCDVNILVYKQGSSISSDSPVQQSKRQSVTQPVGVNNNSEVPAKYSLSQNYPNPFNPATYVKFSIPKDGIVSLKVYDMLGNEIAVYLDGFVKAGIYSAEIDGSNWSSGVYFYKLSATGGAGDFTDTKKMMLVK